MFSAWSDPLEEGFWVAGLLSVHASSVGWTKASVILCRWGIKGVCWSWGPAFMSPSAARTSSRAEQPGKATPGRPSWCTTWMIQLSGVLGRLQSAYCTVSFPPSGPLHDPAFRGFGQAQMLCCPVSYPLPVRQNFTHDVCQWCWDAPPRPPPPSVEWWTSFRTDLC